MKVIGFGEIIWDVYPEEQVIGGAMLNFCAHMAHLGDEVYLMSAVGHDELGKAALCELRRHGVRTDLVQINEKSTGKCLVTLDENKIPSYNVLTDTSYDNISSDDGTVEKIKSISADLFVFNTLIQRSPVSRGTLLDILEKISFRDVFCDINVRKNCYDRESLLLCLEKATVVKISNEEGHFLVDEGILSPSGDSFPREVAVRFPNIKAVVYTLGAEGSEVYDSETGRLFRSGTPEKVRIVSTVGAGDCYGATFCHGYFSGKTIPEAIADATERSNIVVSHREAVPF